MRTAIVLFRSTDLRLLDHEPLIKAHASFDKVLHLFCFDPRWFGRSRIAGFPRVGPLRAKFLLESVDSLRTALRERGAELVIRTGAVESIVPLIARSSHASSVLAHADCNVEERAADAKLRTALGTSIPLELLWGGQTLFHPSDVPMSSPHSLPSNFSAFRRAAESGSKIRPALPIPQILKAAPDGSWLSGGGGGGEDPLAFPLASNGIIAIGANIGLGRRPSLAALGAVDNSELFKSLNHRHSVSDLVSPPSASLGTLNDGESPSSPSSIDPRSGLRYEGGEKAGLARLESWIFTGDHLKEYKETRNGLLGADYSSKLSPWLAHGCISPRTIAAAVAKYEATRLKNDSTYWLLFELMWRDFMRFYARKEGSAIYKAAGPRGHLGGGASWKRDLALESAWARGATGYPFVDAAMRELLTTGFQSNRMRP
jgi:deoxyribodipyrimidine photo-lyase